MYAAYTKLHFDGAWHLRDYHFFFAMAINSYHMLPLGVVRVDGPRFCRGWSWLLGALLILGVGLRWAAWPSRALLVVFMIALTHAAMLGLEINCGCFGTGSVKPDDGIVS